MYTKLLLFIYVFISSIILGQWVDGQEALYVIGQPDFIAYIEDDGKQNLHDPRSIALDIAHNKMYVADFGNQRVLRYSYPITQNNPTPEIIFGITGFFNGQLSATQNTFIFSGSVAVHNGTLWVCDQVNRILKFSNAYLISSDSPNADGILGQVDYDKTDGGTTASSFGTLRDICIDSSGNMWVADYGNSRVLKFNNVNNKPNGAVADLVLGQNNFSSREFSRTQSSMAMPYGICVSGIGSSTKVWVADAGYNRVLRFDNPTENGALAKGVLGQSDYTSGSYGTTANKFFFGTIYGQLTVDNSGRLYVSDGGNGRIMIFNNAANKSNGASADNVLGQSNLNSMDTINGGASHFYYDPRVGRAVFGVTVDNVNNLLLVADRCRILIFKANSMLPVELTTSIPNNYILSQNYPNPFNSSTKIKFDIPKQSRVKLFVYDILGREIEKLVDREMNPGTYETNFEGRDLPSGIYFYKLITEGFTLSKKMILIR